MIDHAIFYAIGILLLALLLAICRLVKGPSTPDRIVALDLMGSIMVGIIICLGIEKKNSIYIDVVLVITLVLFIGTVAMSKYLTQNRNKNGNNNNTTPNHR